MRLLFLLSIFLNACSSCSFPEEKPKNKSLVKNWQNEFYQAYGIDAPPTIVNDSLVLRTGDVNLTCFRIEDGSIKWQEKISEDLTLQTRLLQVYNGFVLGTHVEDLRAWDLNNGNEVWRFELPDDRGFLTGKYSSINGNIIYLPTHGYVKTINIFGEINYLVKINGASKSAIYDNGKLYCGSGWHVYDNEYKGRITCLDAASGDSLWAFNTERGGFYSMAPIIEDGVVYCGTVEGYADFYAIDAETGQQIWKHEGLSAYHALLVEDVLYVNSGSNIHALDKSDGSEIWFAYINTIGTEPIAYLDGYIYYTGGAPLRIIDAKTGEIVHQMYSEDGTSFWYASAGGGKVFLQSAEHLYCYDPWEAD